jgi:hypothetical protein
MELRYWISWYQPTDDERPLTCPPNENVIGWWNSGSDDSAWTLCALVRADSEEQAKSSVLKDWPEAERWRFANQVDSSWIPGDRFPLSDWMIDRGFLEPQRTTA